MIKFLGHWLSIIASLVTIGTVGVCVYNNQPWNDQPTEPPAQTSGTPTADTAVTPSIPFLPAHQETTTPTPAASSTMEISTTMFWQDYTRDPTGATSRYAGNNLHFVGVNVDQVFLGDNKNSDHYFIQEGTSPDTQVRFISKTLSDIVNIKEGSVVEIIGRDVSMEYGYPSIYILSVVVIE